MSKQLNKKYLLNESKCFCMAPWMHMNVWPSGETFPCCVAENQKENYGNINQKSIYDLWNSNLAKELRTNMLNETYSEVCYKCYELEKANIGSLRKRLNKDYSHHIESVQNTLESGQHNRPNFAYMDIRFSNLCNMSCRTCTPSFSSKWYDDFLKAYGKVDPSVAPSKLIQLKILDKLKPYLQDVEEIYWAGGEPLIMKEHWDIMNILLDIGKSNSIDVRYNTNLSSLYFKNLSILDLWKKFKYITISASLDGQHKRAEYIRKGTKWPSIISNMQTILKSKLNVRIEISPTISILNIWHLPDFHRDWVEQKLVKNCTDFKYFNFLIDPTCFSIQVLPKNIKQKITKKWNDHINWIKDLNIELSYIDQCYSVIEYMNLHDKSNLLIETKKELEKFDKVRNENWQDYLPELLFLENIHE